jgi:hypothetical protein
MKQLDQEKGTVRSAERKLQPRLIPECSYVVSVGVCSGHPRRGGLTLTLIQPSFVRSRVAKDRAYELSPSEDSLLLVLLCEPMLLPLARVELEGSCTVGGRKLWVCDWYCVKPLTPRPEEDETRVSLLEDVACA